MPQLLIVADDLTGAADTGAAFAEVGLRTAIPLGATTHRNADVLALSTESRDFAADAAARVVATAVAELTVDERGGPRWLYKKIDSALRGHPRDELLAAMRATGIRSALVAPAFPGEGRTTVGGRQYIDGVPLKAGRFGHSGASGDLVALFTGEQSPLPQRLDLAMVRTGPGAIHRVLEESRAGIVIADAETDDDLLALARAVSEARPRVLCGSAGLARQLALTLPLRRTPPLVRPSPHAAGPVLVVAGSQHQATARQVDTVRQRGVPVICPPQKLFDDPSSPIEPIVAEVAGRLAARGSTVLTTVGLAPFSRQGPSVAARLAQIATAAAVRRCVGGLVLTGGDVAAAVCAALSTASLWLGGEIAPGLPWGVLEGGALPGAPVVTKAGSFGNDGTLLRCIDHLTRVAMS